MNEINQRIRTAMAASNMETARTLLEEALRNNPDAETFYLAARLTSSPLEKRALLVKAIEHDPWHQEAMVELSRLDSSPTTHSRPTTLAVETTVNNAATQLINRSPNDTTNQTNQTNQTNSPALNAEPTQLIGGNHASLSAPPTQLVVTRPSASPVVQPVNYSAPPLNAMQSPSLAFDPFAPPPVYILQAPTPTKKASKLPWLVVGLSLLAVVAVIVVALVVVSNATNINFNSSNTSSTNSSSNINPAQPVATATPSGPRILFPAYECLPAITSDQNLTGSIKQACINPADKRPRQGGTVKVYGRLIINGKLIDNAVMYTDWNFVFLPDAQRDSANRNGVAVASYNLGAITTPDVPVRVDVSFLYNGVEYVAPTTNTVFVPQSR